MRNPTLALLHITIMHLLPRTFTARIPMGITTTVSIINVTKDGTKDTSSTQATIVIHTTCRRALPFMGLAAMVFGEASYLYMNFFAPFSQIWYHTMLVKCTPYIRLVVVVVVPYGGMERCTILSSFFQGVALSD